MEVHNGISKSNVGHIKKLDNLADAYMWFFLFDMDYQPGGSGGRMTISLPLLHTIGQAEQAVKFVEHTYKGVVVKVKSIECLYYEGTK